MITFTEKIEQGKAIQAILAGEEVVVRYPALLGPRFNFISGFLYRLLSELSLGYLSELILVLLKEITSNCSKANAKRLFFESRNIDIKNLHLYDQGVASFKKEALSDWDTFSQSISTSSYFIALHIKRSESNLELTVENNTEILPQEWQRINARFESFKKYRDINLAFNEIKDSSEGAGLGIVLTLVLLQNAGIPPESFTIVSQGGNTFSKIIIPGSIMPLPAKEKFKEIVLGEINSLPSFPENINLLIQLCNSDTASVFSIAEKIQKDPALTAQILKLVHSAGYMNRLRNPTLSDAIKIIGLKVIKNLLMVSGARNVMNSKFKHKGLEHIWEDSNRVSFFARQLSKSKPAIEELASVAGLLFELGKIVLISLSPEIVKFVTDFLIQGRIRSGTVLEEVALGISHPEIGALLAEKWKFPEPLVVALRYQDKPLQSPADYEDLVHTIYMATMVQSSNQQHGDYFTVEHEILQKFAITSQAEFKALAKKLDEAYKSSGSNI